MQSIIKRVEQALHDLRLGKMVVLTDHPDRENEGDLIVAAEKITPEIMNFMIRQGTGIVCMPLTAERIRELNIPLMMSAQDNTCARGTQFTVSIDAKEGITTGVSAADRALTVSTIMHEDAKHHDFVMPGHLFPLCAKEGGVLERPGHTEGSLDLMRLAGFKPAAVLCEIMNPDGTMARGKELETFSKQHDLTLLSIDDIIAYRLSHENQIQESINTLLPMQQYGTFNMTVIKEKITGEEHVVLSKENKNTNHPLLVRIHSSCLTGDLFTSKRCDCHQQLHFSLRQISEQGGMLIYLNQEGRGIGLFNKIKAYALQDKGIDTVEANTLLGFPADSRNYNLAANILHQHNINHVRLLTNNPRKINELTKYGIQVQQVTLPQFANEHNQFYLQTKKEKLHHHIELSIKQDCANE